MLYTAPMLKVSDRHCRYLWRLLTKNTVLFTEMITTSAILSGKSHKFLHYHAAEKPLVLQLGGNNPLEFKRSAAIISAYDYDEINLNIGCPSSKVRQGNFGACLMAKPMLVASCLRALEQEVTIPLSVKCRIGIDNYNSYDFLANFIRKIVDHSNCRIFYIHARIALLNGLNPKQNRTIPPLNYDFVYQIKRDFPQLKIIINGGINSVNDCINHLQYTDGVMLGRAIQQNPWLLTELDTTLYNQNSLLNSLATRQLLQNKIIHQYIDYVDEQMFHHSHISLGFFTRHLNKLFFNIPQSRQKRTQIASANSLQQLKTIFL